MGAMRSCKPWGIFFEQTVVIKPSGNSWMSQGGTGAEAQPSVSRQQRSWPIHISQQKCWTTSLTTYATCKTRQIAVASFSKIPFRPCRVSIPLEAAIMENRLSVSLHLSRAPHHLSFCQIPSGCYTRGCRRGWLDPTTFLRVVRLEMSVDCRSLLSLFPYSMDSHPFSDLSAFFLPPFRPQTVSI